jgi:hypothetical protein
MMRILFLSATGLLFASGTALAAAPALKEQPQAALYQALEACRTITVDGERLACFDKAMSRLGQAVAAKDVVIVDKSQIERTKRGLFGLKLPNLGLFGDKDDEPESQQLSQIESKVQSVRNTKDGWLLTLEDGSIWQQTDSVALGISPKKGMAVVVKRAALGSYKMSVGGQPAIRAKRVV